MFITLARSDTIRVAPQYLVGGVDRKSTDLDTILSQEIDIKYADTVLPGYGLVLCLWAIDEIKDATVMPGDGGAYTFVRFRLLVFSPEPAEVVVAKVKAVDPKGGVRCSVDFFMDIVVPPHLLPEGVVYNAAIKGYSMLTTAQDGEGEGEAPPDFRVDDYVRIKVSSVLYRTARAGGGGGAAAGMGVEGPSSAIVPASSSSAAAAPGAAASAHQHQQQASMSLSMLDVAGASAAAVAAEAAQAAAGGRRFDPKTVPTTQQLLRPGVLTVGSASTDGAMLPTAATVLPSSSVAPSYSLLLGPPELLRPMDAKDPSIAETKARYTQSSNHLLFPPLGQAFTSAGTSTWRLETGLASHNAAAAALGGGHASSSSAAGITNSKAQAAGGAKKTSAAGSSGSSNSNNNLVLAAAAAALRHGATTRASGNLPDYLERAESLAPAIAPRALGTARRLQQSGSNATAAGIERFFTRDAVSNVLLPAGVVASAASASASASSMADGDAAATSAAAAALIGTTGSTTALVSAGGPAALLAPFLSQGNNNNKGAGGASASGGAVAGRYNPPMAVVASMKGAGLGPLGWWEGDEQLDYLPLLDMTAFETRADGSHKYKVAEDAVTRAGKAFAPILFASTAATTTAAAAAGAGSSSSSEAAVAAVPSAKRQRKNSTVAAAAAATAEPEVSASAGDAEAGEAADRSGDGDGGSGASNKTTRANSNSNSSSGGARGGRGGRGGKK